jgi:integrase
LNASRTNEVIGAKPSELDLRKGLWTVPAERMKAGKEHRMPLSPRAVEIAKAQPDGEYLFPGRDEGQPLSNMVMLELLKRMGREDLTVHGFRSTFRDWAAECTTYPNEVAEMALAHAISDKVEAAYRRGEPRPYSITQMPSRSINVSFQPLGNYFRLASVQPNPPPHKEARGWKRKGKSHRA